MISIYQLRESTQLSALALPRIAAWTALSSQCDVAPRNLTQPVTLGKSLHLYASVSTSVKWRNDISVCYLLTGKDSESAIFQIDGEMWARPAGPLVEAGKGRTDLRPTLVPISSMPAFVWSAQQAAEFIFH